jgi:hypothetical protein
VRVMTKYLGFALLITLHLNAQNWQKGSQSDPMTDKAYTAFGLRGNGVNENFTGALGVVCAQGKFQYARLTIDGMTFHYDSFAALRNPPYVTNMKVRTGKKVETKGFLVTQDMKFAQVSKQEMEKIFAAGGAIFEFADGVGTVHYLQFEKAVPGAEMEASCALK